MNQPNQPVGVLWLDDFELFQHAALKSIDMINDRSRVLRRFLTETGVQPYRAEPIQIVRFFAAHRDDWSASTHSTYNSYFRAFYAWLQLTDKRDDNPMVKVGTPKAPDRVPRPVADRSLVTMLTARMHHRTRVMILCASLAGMRVSEIAKIRGEDVELDRPKPRIRILGKGSKIRYVKLHPLLVDAAATMPDRGWWFPANSRRPGEHIRGRSTSDIIGDVMRRTKVTGTPHSLRHWFGTTLLDDGADLRTVQELLGHKSVATTQIYTRVSEGKLGEAVDRLDPYRALKTQSSVPRLSAA